MTTHPLTRLDKFDVLLGLFTVWDCLEALLDGAAEAEWRVPTSLPGWDVQAVVSHLIGTESFLAGVAPPESDIDVSALEHVRNDIGAMNERWVRHLSGESGAGVLQRFRVVTQGRRKALEGMAEEAWNAPTPTPAGQDSYGRFMRIRVFDCWMHEQDIREAVRRPCADDELDSVASRLALDEISAVLGFVVGKRAQAPEGSRILFELIGPLARRIRIGVQGRAQLVEDFGGLAPTATIRLDGLQFTRLAGGRPRCSARSQDIELGGDTGLAAHIVEHLNFVI